MTDPFESSRRKIARAKVHIEDLERESRTFFDERPYSVVIETDPNAPQHDLHKLRFNKTLPDSFATLTEESVHNLRSALDNIGYGLAISGGKISARHTA